MFKVFYKTYFILIFLAVSLMSLPQVAAQQLPQINYQGVARQADGSPVSEQAIALRLTIKDRGASGNIVYSETRLLTTNKFGLFTTVIGSTGALSQTGTMAGVIWATGNKFLQVEIDPAGGNRFVDMGTSQLQSVPYAIHAGEASPTGNAGGDLSGTYPHPVVSKLQGAAVSNVAPNNGQILKWNGTAWAPSDEPGVVGTISSNLPLTSTLSGGNAVIAINKADNTTDGYLSKTDWVNFNAKATPADVDAGIAVVNASLTSEINRATLAENTKLNIADTTVMLLPYAKRAATQTAIDTKLNIADTTAMLLPYAKQSATLTALAERAPLASPTFTGTVSGISKIMVGLGNVDNTTDLAKPVSTATQTAINEKLNIADTTAMLLPYAKQSATLTALDAKAPLASPTFTGTVSGISKTMVGLGNVDNTTDLAKPVSTATQTAIDAKLNITDTTAMLLPYAKQSATLTALAEKAPLASPTFTGTVSGISKTMVGLGNVDNTTDLAKPVSSATQTAIDAKLNIADTTAMLLPYAKQSATLTALDAKAPLASPTFTGTVSGISKTMVGLGNVDNTTDLAKPVSTATQTAIDTKLNIADTTAMLLPYARQSATLTALDAKAPLASPTFTGTVSGISKTMVGLGNVDNTTDLAKPVSTATQTAIDAKLNIADTTAMLSSYVKNEAMLTAIGAKVNITDTASMLLPYINIADTAAMLLPYAKTDGAVDLTSAQSIAGAKTFTGDITVNGIRIGRGQGNDDQNTAIGVSALGEGTGYRNTAVGHAALGNYEGTSFDNNTAVGYFNSRSVTTGQQNTSIGAEALMAATAASNNTAIGAQSLLHATGGDNTALGYGAGAGIIGGTGNTLLGAHANVSTATLSNATAIGKDAIVNASNKIQLGNTDVTTVNTSGDVTAKSFKKSGGTASQYLMADGSVTNVNSPVKTFGALGIVLSSSHSGTIIYTQNGANPFFPEDLPDGFNCAIINYSNFTFTSNTLTGTKFYSRHFRDGSATFSIVTGGMAHVKVVSIGGVKRYYVSGDLQ
jgi:hypothetical protein